MVALKVLETSGVDHPAHLEEGWIVMKSANTQENSHMEQGLEEAYIERVVELEKGDIRRHLVGLWSAGGIGRSQESGIEGALAMGTGQFVQD